MRQYWYAVCLLALTQASYAQDTPQVTVLAEGLKNPTGVAVLPEGDVVYIAESGAGRVVRLLNGEVQEVVVGFPTQADDLQQVPIGPLGLAFLDAETLVVGGGGRPAGEDQLQIFSIPAAGAEPLTAEASSYQAALPAEDDHPAVGDFYGVACTAGAIYVTTRGDDQHAWIARAAVTGTKPGPLKRFLATKTETGVDTPLAVTISPRQEIVVGQSGAATAEQDALLTFYSSRGRLLLNLPTGLRDISGLTYSATTGRLYAIDSALAMHSEGGLFELVGRLADDGTQIVQAVKTTDLDQPTAVASDTQGRLIVTTRSGQVLQITIE